MPRQTKEAAHRAEVTDAHRLYAIDNAAARRGERPYPRMASYTTSVTGNGPRYLVATDYAKSRFGELTKRKSAA